MGDAGGAVVQQLMADLAAASERAEEAEARAAELEGHNATCFPLPALSFLSDLYLRPRADTRARGGWSFCGCLVLATCRKATAPD
jgi:hypothetical protein